MEVGKSLLVALMFVTILTLGIANILSSLANSVTRGSDVRKKPLYFGWLGIVLLAYLDLFWQSDMILTTETWRFSSFLFTVTGPIFLLFATQVLISSDALEDVERDATGERLVSSRFLILLLLLQVWSTGVSALLVEGITRANLVEAFLAVILFMMILSRRRAIHVAGTIAAAVTFIGSLALLGLGILT